LNELKFPISRMGWGWSKKKRIPVLILDTWTLHNLGPNTPISLTFAKNSV
jgi:hypothetical protein